ncbi:uncharacterized protein KGF55_000096 [Candida pseudojiufengensis]|uniref:uncharacterized protein n=1 Tax=Candida pseudojiufengensis TaxID=497109 RepID=UPI00222408D4|nr:uncharacterized protein KGF55_000096 [Candida pseudojiufengensis]KAI5967608.1 hypothetical protein KGF55_000096 [Candida pseudojiufengensis]
MKLNLEEITNRSLIALLRAFGKKNDQDWSLKLPIVEYAYNAHVHKVMKMTPFEADYIPEAPHVDSKLRRDIPIRSVPNNPDYTVDSARMLKLHRALISHNKLESQYNQHRQSLMLQTQDL